MRKSKLLLLALITLNLGLVLLALIVFPGALGGERTIWIFADSVLLIGYAAWVVLASPPSFRTLALGTGAGMAQFLDVAREYLTTWPPALLFFSIVLTIAIFAIAGIRVHTKGAAVQGAHAAVTAMLLLLVMVWVLNAAVPDRIGAALSSDPDYLRSGITSMRTYIVWNTLSSAFSHALVLPLFGAAAAAAMGGLTSRLRRQQI